MSVLASILVKLTRSNQYHLHRYGVKVISPLSSKIYKSSSSNENDDGTDDTELIVQSSSASQPVILVQRGGEMHELPLVLRKPDRARLSALCSNDRALDQPATMAASELDGDPLQSLNGNDDDNDASSQLPLGEISSNQFIFEALNECASCDEILRTLGAIDDSLINENVLQRAFSIIFCLEHESKLLRKETENIEYQQFIERICKIATPECLIMLLEKCRPYPTLEWLPKQICDQILQLSTENKLSIEAICRAIHAFTNCRRFDEADKFWAAFDQIGCKIDQHNLPLIFGTLPKLKVSRSIVYALLDRHFSVLYPLLEPTDIIAILQALADCKYGHPVRMLRKISTWLALRIEDMDENSLEPAIRYLTILNFSDTYIIEALEQYMTKNAIYIENYNLVVEILKHVRKFRIFNQFILNGCSEFVVRNISKIGPQHFADIVCPYGELHFTPYNAEQFWQAIETYLQEHFYEIGPNAIIDIVLSAVYVQIYPINFIDRIFNQKFMRPLELYKSSNSTANKRNQLKLLDAAMTLECKQFSGPFLPRQMIGDRITNENRVKCILNDNIDVIKMIAGDETSFTLSTQPKQMPYHTLYTIDILFHPAGWNLLLSLNKLRDRNTFVAALIHLPEDYDSSQQHLTGSQQMRIRHLRKIGFKVVSLKYSTLAKLAIHRKELYNYYVQQMKLAVPPILTSK